MMITLTTDFGLTDAFVGTMKGVILGIAPQTQIVDISHGVPAQDILAGALLLEESCPYFPDGTIHVAVVDPGVGSSRAAVAIRTDRFFFIGPDNGIFDLVLKKDPARWIVSLTNPAFHRQPVSHTFHGRDIFAPVAAHLAAGARLDDLGVERTSLQSLAIAGVESDARELRGCVLRMDRFGNAITNLRSDDVNTWRAGRTEPILIQIGAHTIAGLHTTYADVSKGQPVAYLGSGGRLEIGVAHGSAAERLGIAPGDPVHIRWP